MIIFTSKKGSCIKFLLFGPPAIVFNSGFTVAHKNVPTLKGMANQFLSLIQALAYMYQGI